MQFASARRAFVSQELATLNIDDEIIDADDESDLSDESKGRAGAPEGKPLKTYLLTVAYDGSEYCGWQYQPDQRSVQETLEKALKKVLGHPVRALGSSRTDSGVHALGQAVVIRSSAWNTSVEKMPLALNTYLPLSVVVRNVREVARPLHPLRDSTGKRYEYHIYNSRRGDPIGGRTHWWVRRKINLSAMQGAAAMLIGRKDFASFQSAGSPRSSTIRTIRSLVVESKPYMDGQMITVTIEADGFLYNMVRNIVGTLVQVGVGREAPQWVTQVLEALDRQVAGQTAPAQGLFLMEVMFNDAASQ